MAGKTVTGWLDIDPGLIRRVILTTTWLGAISALVAALYLGFARAGAYAVGVAFGIADLALIHALVRELTGPCRKRILALLFFLKFVALYAVGIVVLLVLHLEPVLLLAGFSLFLFVVILKILGRALLASRWLSKERRGAGGRLLNASPEVRNRQ